jgi:hypothetical protein
VSRRRKLQADVHDELPVVEALTQYGTTLTVGPGVPGTISTPPGDVDFNHTIEIQAQSLPGGVLSTTAATGYLAAFVSYYVGGAQFTKTIAPIGLNVRRIPVSGRQVTVTVFLSPPGAPAQGGTSASGATLATAPVKVNVAVCHENESKLPIEFYGPQWIQAGIGNIYMTGTAQQAVNGVQSRGILLAARISVTFMPTGAGSSAFWVHLFDQTAAGGTYPIWRSGALTADYQSYSFDDEFGPCIEWDQGLWIGASSVAGQYSACGGAPLFTLDLKVGQ